MVQRQSEVVICFLSCSVRREDRALVAAVADKVLQPMGFRCITVGRNFSQAAQPDDVIRDLMSRAHCLVGVATARLDAVDRSAPDHTLTLTTPYVLQETSMAHQGRLPFLMLKTEDVTLQGVTARNLWLPIDRSLRHGRVAFKVDKEVVYSALQDLHRQAVVVKKARSDASTRASLGQLATWTVAGAAAYKGLDLLMRPSCFGEFYYRDPECKDCPYRTKCKADKASREE